MDRRRSTKIRRGGGAGGGVDLPQEIIEQILQPLPVKSLLKFKCVSKQWRSLIESRSFVKKHLESSKRYSTFPHWRFVTIGSLKVVNGMKKPGSMIPTPMDDPTNNHLIKGWVLGCCNGLLCTLEHSSYFLWNPATRICIKLPSSGPLKPVRYGFGWDEESGAYKVFDGMLDEHDRKIGRLYSSETNSWSRVDCRSLSMSKDRVNCSKGMGVFARGKIHWISECGSYVEYLDLKSKVFGRVELPVEQEEGVGLWLREREGCLSLLCNNNSKEDRRELREEEGLLDVWVMEEECDWVKKKSVIIPSEFGGLTSTFLLCNGKEEKISDLYQNFTYVESLVGLRWKYTHNVYTQKQKNPYKCTIIWGK